MHVDIAGQAVVFGQGFLLGAALGLLYDGMRTLRRSIRLAALAFVLDLLFWLAAVAALFALTLLRDSGEVHLYHMLAFLLGGGLYFVTLSRLVLPVLLWLAGIVRAVWSFLTAPARAAGRAGKNFLKNRKKHFQNWLEWYKINMIHRFAKYGGEGAATDEGQTRGHCHKAAGAGAAGGSGRRPAVHPGKADRGPKRAGRAGPPGGGAAGGQRRPGGRYRPQRRPGVPGGHRQK
ncbi:MAG: hypothetical protein HFF22_09475 [Oscillospiraceae bacterium]|nr:hypothetical protein [Oscillospiraceae bacterium]